MGGAFDGIVILILYIDAMGITRIQALTQGVGISHVVSLLFFKAVLHSQNYYIFNSGLCMPDKR